GLTPPHPARVTAYTAPTAHPAATAAAAPAAPARPNGVEQLSVTVRGPANAKDPMCAGAPPPITPTAGDWASTGVDDPSTRFQRKPGLSLADIPKLKGKWAYATPGGGPPTGVA